MRRRDNRIQKILRVNLSDRSVCLEELPEDWTAKYIGCRGINSRLLFDEIKAGTDPLGPNNLLCFGTGPLDGTPAGQGRISVACKSERGTLIEGSSGGFFGPELRRAGIDYIALKGVADRPVYLYIEDEKVEIRDASHLWGLKTDETDAALRREFSDPNIQHRYIGPAGENMVHSSPIFGNLHSSGGRGCGQVMGSKLLKAVVVKGSQGIPVADYDGFIDAYKAFHKQLDLVTSRDAWSPIWGAFGSTVINRLFTDQGGVMTRNASQMHWDPEKCTRISAEPYLADFVTRAKACFCCPWPGCKKQHEVKAGPFKGFKGGNYWAANSVVFGPLIDNDELDLALVLAGLCNQYGLDMFHVGYTRYGWFGADLWVQE
jgi:aldehyde:ferredoxin oxidoreductase